MASLTTVYLISIILTSVAGIGSAFLGNRIHTIETKIEEVLPEVLHEQPIQTLESEEIRPSIE